MKKRKSSRNEELEGLITVIKQAGLEKHLRWHPENESDEELLELLTQPQFHKPLVALLRYFQIKRYEDGLTGLPNRDAFVERLKTLCDSFRKDGQSILMICFDLRTFKTYNDLLGHDVMDDVMRKAAHMAARSGELFGINPLRGEAETTHRCGGDEFSILFTLPDTQGEDLANLIVNMLTALNRRIEEPLRWLVELAAKRQGISSEVLQQKIKELHPQATLLMPGIHIGGAIVNSRGEAVRAVKIDDVFYFITIDEDISFDPQILEIDISDRAELIGTQVNALAYSTLRIGKAVTGTQRK